jgi:hypothetical protein
MVDEPKSAQEVWKDPVSSIHEADHRVSLPTPGEEVSDLISMAPGSQEATFLSEDEHEEGESSSKLEPSTGL